jgi:hypothetical protein
VWEWEEKEGRGVHGVEKQVRNPYKFQGGDSF